MPRRRSPTPRRSRGWPARRSLIELHPAAEPGVRELLEERLVTSHEVEAISSQTRRASRFDAQLRPIRGLRRIDRELLVAEFRDGVQDWLFAVPV